MALDIAAMKDTIMNRENIGFLRIIWRFFIREDFEDSLILLINLFPFLSFLVSSL
jgi:hypothetical protein